MWIYLGETLRDENQDGYNWIDASGFGHEDISIMDLYAAGTYFVMQTFTTVGYGDIVISTSVEQFLASILVFIGVIFFSFASGSLTNIITN